MIPQTIEIRKLWCEGFKNIFSKERGLHTLDCQNQENRPCFYENKTDEDGETPYKAIIKWNTLKDFVNCQLYKLNNTDSTTDEPND